MGEVVRQAGGRGEGRVGGKGGGFLLDHEIHLHIVSVEHCIRVPRQFFEDTTNCHPNEIPSKIPPTPFNPIVHNKHSIEVDRHITGDP